MLYVQAPAKVNLTLDVLGRRPDGYHEVLSVMQAIDLADVLSFRPVPEGETVFYCSSPEVPPGEDNLVLRAVELLRRHTGCRSGVAIELAKRIPVAAGLAGGSSDAAATLKGLNRFWHLGLNQGELLELAARLGSDVPFCLLGGTALARGRGELVTPLPAPPTMWLVLVKPSFGVSTAAVYQAMDRRPLPRHPDVAAMAMALAHGDRGAIEANLANVLEGVTLEMHPTVGFIKERLLDAGARVSLMSGSGPTVFGVFWDEDQARRVKETMADQDWGVWLARSLPPDPL